MKKTCTYMFVAEPENNQITELAKILDEQFGVKKIILNGFVFSKKEN